MDPKVIEQIADKFDEFANLFNGEIGHARYFVEYHETTIYLNSLNGEGYIFNELLNLWQKKENGYFVNIVAEFLETQMTFVINEYSKDKKKSEKLVEASKILKKVRSQKHADSVWKLARGKLVNPDFQSKMNSSPNLIPLPKGRVIDLKKLEVRLRNKTDYFDFELPFEFNPNKIAKAQKFFEQIMNNDKEVVSYLQTILGYCMTGETDLRSMFIFWGSGSNGKSTLCDLLKKILNKFYIAADKKIFIRQEKGSSHTAHLMPLIGARLAVLSETEEGEKLNESLIKALTGNDTISARELYGKQFAFKPVAKYVMLTNHKPTFNINDQALLDRIKYVPFTARFTSKPKNGEFPKDAKFIERLMSTYLDQVFSWLCIGANNYYKSKGSIDIPKSLQDATDEYIKEIDNVSKFIEDKCIRKDEAKVKQSELYDIYRNYCSENGLTYQRNSEFYKRLENLGFTRVASKGYHYIKGLEVENYLD